MDRLTAEYMEENNHKTLKQISNETGISYTAVREQADRIRNTGSPLRNRIVITKDELRACAGLTYNEAAEKLGCDRRTVWQTTYKYGMAGIFKSEVGKKSKLTEDMLLPYAGQTYTQIAIALGCSVSVISNACKRLDIRTAMGKTQPIHPKTFREREVADQKEQERKLTKKMTVLCQHGCGRKVTRTVSVDHQRGMRFTCYSCNESDGWDGYTGYRVAL